MLKLKSSLMAGAALAAMLPGRAGDGATSLASTVDSLEAVPEALHGFYVEKDGKFQLQVTGLPSQENVTRLEEAIRKERNDHKQTKDTLNRITNNGARQPDDIIADLDRIPELEATQGQIDEDKVNTLVEARIKARVGPVERERDQLKTQVEAKDKTIGEFEAKDRTRTIHDKVREDAVKAKVLPEAVEDALLLADRIFEVDDSGRVVTKDNVGVTPGIEPGVWFTDVQKTRPHWWGPSTGGGAGGNRGGGGDATSNTFTHENWNLTAQGVLVNSDRPKAEQLAKAAGTTIGGQRPPAKK
jgi:hypothetical protein